MVQEPRTERLEIRIAPGELTMLHELAEHAGLSASDIIRTLIRREHAATLEERRPKRKR